MERKEVEKDLLELSQNFRRNFRHNMINVKFLRKTLEKDFFSHSLEEKGRERNREREREREGGRENGREQSCSTDQRNVKNMKSCRNFPDIFIRTIFLKGENFKRNLKYVPAKMGFGCGSSGRS